MPLLFSTCGQCHNQSASNSVLPHFQNSFHWRFRLSVCPQDLYLNCLVPYLLPTEHRTVQQKGCALYGTISRLSKAVKPHYIPLRISMSRLRTTHYSSLSSLAASSYSSPSNWQLKSQVEHFQRDRTFNWNFQQFDAVGTLQDCLGTWRPCHQMCSVILLTVSKIWIQYYLPPCKTCQTNLPTNFIIVHTPRNVHAGENVRLHSAGHKQTGSFFFECIPMSWQFLY